MWWVNYWINRKELFIFTCIKNSILLSSTSSARWFLILAAGSISKCKGVSRSCRGSEQLDWSQLKASSNIFQVTLLPSIIKHLGFLLSLLFSTLFRIFLKLCWGLKSLFLNITACLKHEMAKKFFKSEKEMYASNVLKFQNPIKPCTKTFHSPTYCAGSAALHKKTKQSPAFGVYYRQLRVEILQLFAAY